MSGTIQFSSSNLLERPSRCDFRVHRGGVSQRTHPVHLNKALITYLLLTATMPQNRPIPLEHAHDSEHTHTRLLKCAYSPSDSLSSHPASPVSASLPPPRALATACHAHCEHGAVLPDRHDTPECNRSEGRNERTVRDCLNAEQIKEIT